MIAGQEQNQKVNKTTLEERGIQFDIGVPITAVVSIKNAVVVGFGDGTIRFFEDDLKPRIVEAHKGVILSMDTNDEYILTGGEDGRFLQISIKGEIQEIGNFGSRWVDKVAAYKYDRVCSSGSTAYIWSKGEKKAKLLEHSSTVGGLAFSSNGKYLAVSYYGGATVWERLARKWKSSKYVWKGSHGLVSFSPDGKYLVTAMQENELHAWRLRDKDNLKMSGYPAKIKSFSWVGDTPYLVTSGADEAICWPFDGKDGPKGRKPICVANGGNQYSTYVQSFPGEEAILAGFRDGSVILSELDEKKNDYIMRNPTGSEVSAIAVTPDRSHILIGDEKGSILWSSLWSGEV